MARRIIWDDCGSLVCTGYKGADGKVYISGMNTGLMGKMFGGKIAEVMGTKVSQDEEKILKGIVLS